MRAARFSRATLPMLVMLGALAGCTAGPDFKAPTAPRVASYVAGSLPARTVSADAPGGQAQYFVSDQKIAAQWWTLFHCAALDKLVEQALRDSPTLAQAQARLHQAQQALAAQTSAFDYPSVNGTLSTARQQINTRAMGLGAAPNPGPFTLYNASVGVSYTLDLFGAQRRALEALRAALDYQRFELAAARLTLAANVVTAVVREASLRDQLRATTTIVDAQRSQLRITEGRHRLGAVPELDVIAQRNQLAQTEATLPGLRQQLAQTRHLLAVYLGVPPGAAHLPAIELAELHLPTRLPLALPSELARQRPDIQAAEALLHQASANVGVATASLYPHISLSASLGTEATGLRDVFGPASGVWNLGAALTQPLFHGGELRARRREAVAAYDQAAAAYRQTVLAGLQNVADTLRALQADAQALQARADAAAQAERTYHITQGQYRAGGLSYLAVLDAQQRVAQARLARIQATAQRYADSAALLQALGGGWWAPGAPD